MAWNVHWQCIFTSYEDRTYCLNICEQDYNGSVESLTGDADVFVTQEDDDDDVFLPIRTQSGYLKVVDEDGLLIERLFPANHSEKMVQLLIGTLEDGVFVKNEGNNAVQWQGFLRSEQYTQDICTPSIVELAVGCMLDSLQSVYIPQEYYPATLTFAQVLKILSESLSPDGIFNSFVFVSDISDPTEYLSIELDMFAFFTIEDTDNGISVQGMSFYDILTSYMMLFGLTARTFGDTLYMVSPDTHKQSLVREYSKSQLNDIITGISVQPVIAEINSLTIYEDVVSKGNVNNLSLIPGARKVKVVFNIIEEDQLLMKTPTMDEDGQDIKKITLDNGIFYIQVSNNLNVDTDYPSGKVYKRKKNGTCKENFYYVRYSLKFNGLYEWMFEDGAISDFVVFRSHTLVTDTLWNIGGRNDRNYYTGAQPARFYYSDEPDYVELLNGMMLQLKHVNSNDSEAVNNEIYSVTSSRKYKLRRGVLVLDLKSIFISTTGYLSSEIMYHKAAEQNLFLWVSVFFAGKYWNGTSWTGNFSVFKVPFADNGTIVSNKSTYISEYNVEANGYWMPLSGISSNDSFVEVKFYDNYVDAGDGPVYAASFLYDFEVTFYRVDEIPVKHNEVNNYELLNNLSRFKDEKIVNLSIGTYNNNEDSPSFILLDGNYLTTLTYRRDNGNTYKQRPEKNLVERMYRENIKIRETIDMITSFGLNFCKTVYEWKNRVFFGIKKQTNWNKDTVEVKFIEV